MGNLINLLAMYYTGGTVPIIKDLKFTFNGFAKWVGFIGGLLAIFFTILQIATALKPPVHELSIQVPKLVIYDSKIRLSVALHNKGDFNEILTDIGFYMVEGLGVHGKENNIKVAEFDKMLLVDSKKSINEIFEVNIDFNTSPFDQLLESGTSYSVVTRFSFVSEKGEFVTDTLPIGVIHFIRDSKSGAYQGDLLLTSMQRTVDFNQSKPALTITNLPRTTEFDLPKLELVK